jgi:hypothetical protein
MLYPRRAAQFCLRVLRDGHRPSSGKAKLRGVGRLTKIAPMLSSEEYLALTSALSAFALRAPASRLNTLPLWDRAQRDKALGSAKEYPLSSPAPMLHLGTVHICI